MISDPTYLRRAALILSVALTFAIAYFGIELAVTDFRWGFIDAPKYDFSKETEPKISFFLEVLGVIGAALVLFGLSVTHRVPQTAKKFITVGAIGMCGIGWFLLIPPILSLLILAFGINRADRLTELSRKINHHK